MRHGPSDLLLFGFATTPGRLLSGAAWVAQLANRRACSDPTAGHGVPDSGVSYGSVPSAASPRSITISGSLVMRGDTTMGHNSPVFSEVSLWEILFRLVGGGLTVGVLILWPSLKIVGAF